MGGREVLYSPGATILNTGSRTEMIYQLSAGRCRIEVQSARNEVKTVGNLKIDDVCSWQVIGMHLISVAG
jgi:hypothetical protein